jgi:hypothetical protein
VEHSCVISTTLCEKQRREREKMGTVRMVRMGWVLNLGLSPPSLSSVHLSGRNPIGIDFLFCPARDYQDSLWILGLLTFGNVSFFVGRCCCTRSGEREGVEGTTHNRHLRAPSTTRHPLDLAPRPQHPATATTTIDTPPIPPQPPQPPRLRTPNNSQPAEKRTYHPHKVRLKCPNARTALANIPSPSSVTNGLTNTLFCFVILFYFGNYI